MSSNLTPFRIEIYNASGYKVGGGPITTATQVNNTKRLDAIGDLSFSLPASDNWGELIVTGTQFDVYDEIDGYLGRFLYAGKETNDVNGQNILTVHCWDKLKLLTYETVGFFRTYNNELVSTVLSEIIALVSGFSVETSVTNSTTISYSGESVYRALDELRDRFGYHFRLKENNTVEFGPFGDLNTEVQFNQFKGQQQSTWLSNDNNAVIYGASIVDESEEIFNKIIPLGFGQGVSQLTIEGATLGNYTVQTESNADGSTRYYISDSDSVSAYGKRTRILQFPNIRPISNSSANVINAANALKLTAEAYMSKHIQPRKEYTVNVRYLRKEIKVGDKVRIKYNQEWNGNNYINIDDYFYVMDITYNRSVDGARSYTLNIANVDDRRTSDQDIIVDVVRDLKDIGVHIPATLAYSPVGPYTKRILGDATAGNRISPTFKVRIEEEVLYLNRALLRFGTSPLKSSITGSAAASNGSHRHLVFSNTDLNTTPANTDWREMYAKDSSAGSGNINITIPILSLPKSEDLWTFDADGSHSHTLTISYGVFEDTETPEGIGILLNGVDITSSLGGPFAPSGGEIEQEIDITDYLINTSGGFRQTHDLQFYATDGQGEIEFECDLLVTIQPIRAY